MKITKKWAAFMVAAGCLVSASSAYAFSDLPNKQQEGIAEALQTKGVIHGISADRFGPAEPLTAAQSVQMLVKAMKLQPDAGAANAGTLTVPSTAWYAQAAETALDHGLVASTIGSWNDKVTKEEFAQMLYKAVTATGDYPLIKMYVTVQDENDMASGSREAVQFLLLTHIAELDAQQKFHPRDNITRMEAAEMVYHAMNFVASHQPVNQPENDDQVAVSVEKVNDQVNRIVLTKEDMPNPGYGLKIDRIEFVSEGKAVAYYTVTKPAPGMMYPQVISTAKASFYMDSKIQVSVKQTGGGLGTGISLKGSLEEMPSVTQ
ncbi:protease complex subunit PrcB family protein [Paenibacillus cineris]|uniref:SLH domain-containing protein n=1 Tax=Paenibacillus cineris TaxID=237530 RepID=A0ABQ4LAF5_9BACL|nr:protease complex subunit PrcB family protein [Paenibacillus cineris]GIO53265.1 hypothetical protein J21TS7_15830 [Paenibacillus cineris]